MATYLIEESDFDTYRKVTPALSSKYDDRVKPYVLESQLADLRELIGDDFYDELIDVAVSGSDHATGITKDNYDLLLPYIKPIIVYYTWVRLLENNQVTITVNSAVRKTNEYSNPTSNTQLTSRITNAQSMAVMYSRDLVKYMKTNRSGFATYFNNVSDSHTGRTSIRISAIGNCYE